MTNTLIIKAVVSISLLVFVAIIAREQAEVVIGLVGGFWLRETEHQAVKQYASNHSVPDTPDPVEENDDFLTPEDIV